MAAAKFFEGWAGYLVATLAFAFTVVGTVIGLVVAKEYWWISILLVVSAFLSSGVFAYRMHRDKETAETLHQDELSRNRSELESAAERLRDAERKLNEVPYNMMVTLQRSLAAYSFSEFGRVLIEHALFIVRMISFVNTSSKPINLRTFTEQGGNLFAVAKAESAALQYLRPGDPFLLVKKSSDGLETPSARLFVHQPPDQKKEVIMFRIADYLSDEMGHMENLARTGDVQGIKGFGVNIIPTISCYEKMNLQNLEDAITRLIQDVASDRKVKDD